MSPDFLRILLPSLCEGVYNRLRMILDGEGGAEDDQLESLRALLPAGAELPEGVITIGINRADPRITSISLMIASLIFVLLHSEFLEEYNKMRADVGLNEEDDLIPDAVEYLTENWRRKILDVTDKGDIEGFKYIDLVRYIWNLCFAEDFNLDENFASDIRAKVSGILIESGLTKGAKTRTFYDLRRTFLTLRTHPFIFPKEALIDPESGKVYDLAQFALCGSSLKIGGHVREEFDEVPLRGLRAEDYTDLISDVSVEIFPRRFYEFQHTSVMRESLFN